MMTKEGKVSKGIIKTPANTAVNFFNSYTMQRVTGAARRLIVNP